MKLNFLLQNPIKTLVYCMIFLFVGLSLDGTIFRLWRLHQDLRDFEIKESKIKQDLLVLKQKVHLTKDPHFLEMEARERFDFVHNDDLIFIFSENYNSLPYFKNAIEKPSSL